MPAWRRDKILREQRIKKVRDQYQERARAAGVPFGDRSELDTQTPQQVRKRKKRRRKTKAERKRKQVGYNASYASPADASTRWLRMPGSFENGKHR
ncbi:MAG: hypothetical protein ACREXP_08910 [Steroidobacteraceae bacterium]